MLRKELREIRKSVENAREKGYFEKLKATASVSSRITQAKALGDDSDTN